VASETDSRFVESYADLGAWETFLATDHEDAVSRVREAFTDTGFGIPTEFSPSENIREHTGKELPPIRVIGIGNPHAGKIVAEETQGDAATLFPCNVVVQQVSEETQRVYHVSLPKVLEQVGLAPDDPASSDAWQEALDIAGSGVEEAFETLNASEVAAADAPAPADD
jgi:uncharacterized protein (DUF302 family)